jgi:uncharacterized small protein (DUF1192 family)
MRMRRTSLMRKRTKKRAGRTAAEALQIALR